MEKPIQKILFGSPGTGKSWRIDKDILPNELGISKEDCPENIIKTVFHPEYTHGDFMGKLVPITRSGKVRYNFYEGDFLKALAQAFKNIIKTNNQGEQISEDVIENTALVIDEINRGNSSAIFGSVFQLLDRDETGWSSYSVNVNEIVFIKFLSLIGVDFSYDAHGEIDKYELKPNRPVCLEEFHEKMKFLKISMRNRTIRIPNNLSIIATMNTSESSIYYMDSAFKRRWEWEFIDIDSRSFSESGISFKSRREWEKFTEKLNSFIKSHSKYIRGIEDKQIGYYFIQDKLIKKETIQSKLMFFLWDNVFTRDKKPLIKLLYGEDAKYHDRLVTFGDFAKQVDLFIEKINKFGNV